MFLLSFGIGGRSRSNFSGFYGKVHERIYTYIYMYIYYTTRILRVLVSRVFEEYFQLPRGTAKIMGQTKRELEALILRSFPGGSRSLYRPQYMYMYIHIYICICIYIYMYD